MCFVFNAFFFIVLLLRKLFINIKLFAIEEFNNIGQLTEHESNIIALLYVLTYLTCSHVFQFCYLRSEE